MIIKQRFVRRILLCFSSQSRVLNNKRSIDSQKLGKVIEFREKQRIPGLCYIYYRKDSDGILAVMGSLWRSGQIRTGIFSSKSEDDEEFIKEIGRQLNLGKHNKMSIFDARPHLNAFMNKMGGKGYLNKDDYDLDEFKFCDIENIHVMRRSYISLLDGAKSPTTESQKYLMEWRGHLSMILTSVEAITKTILNGHSVVINCSDGWDRTPQLSGTTKVVIDGQYRTIEGLRRLISYEFNGFGHKFEHRQFYQGNGEASPIFIQFLNLMFVLLKYYPKYFEYNDIFLFELAEFYCDDIFFEFFQNSYLVNHITNLRVLRM